MSVALIAANTARRSRRTTAWVCSLRRIASDSGAR